MIDRSRVEQLSPAHRAMLARRLDDVCGASPQPRLLAFVLPRPGAVVDTAALRRALTSTVPDYMVPAAIVAVDEWPLTPSGKLDRTALLAIASRSREGHAASSPLPRDATESAIADIWAALLGVGRVGIDDNFFDLGGHSLLLVRLQSRLRDALHQEFTIVDLFRYPTVATLAAAVRARNGNSTPAEERLSEAVHDRAQRLRDTLNRAREARSRGNSG
jgi:acyl carrier protein